jgi:hypothetical protein
MFSKPTAIIFLRRSNLIIAGKRIRSAKFNFLPEVVNNMEIVKPERFLATCQDLFIDRGIKGKRVLIVLDQSIVFSKTITLEESSRNNINSAIEAFVGDMPFEPGQRACIAIRQESELTLYATNADLYQAVLEALRSSGMRKLIAITPSSAYDIDYSAKPSELIEQFMNDKTVRHDVDFSTANPY